MSGKLDEYNKKRDFRKTKEPKGKVGKSGDELKFVVQHHLAQSDHYDLRLEWEGVMPSWAVPKGPSYRPGDRRLAIKVEDHSLEYRDFEGTIPEDEYGGGTVMLWDEGTWKPQQGIDPGKGLEKGELKFILEGERLKGYWALIRMKGDISNGGRNWLLIKEKDRYVQKTAGISDYTTSVRTGRTMKEIAEDLKKN